MAVELNGDFLKLQRVTIRVSEIISVKPILMVQFDFNGNEISRDFPKIAVRTTHEYHEFLYGNEETRDKDLRDIQEKISRYNVSKDNDTQGKTTINISSSTGVNVVSNSENVTINQETQQAASKVIKEMLDELEKTSAISQEVREDIFTALSDFQMQLSDKKEIKRYSWKNLLGMTSDVSTLSSFAITLGQILGYIPK